MDIQKVYAELNKSLRKEKERFIATLAKSNGTTKSLVKAVTDLCPYLLTETLTQTERILQAKDNLPDKPVLVNLPDSSTWNIDLEYSSLAIDIERVTKDSFTIENSYILATVPVYIGIHKNLLINSAERISYVVKDISSSNIFSLPKCRTKFVLFDAKPRRIGPQEPNGRILVNNLLNKGTIYGNLNESFGPQEEIRHLKDFPCSLDATTPYKGVGLLKRLDPIDYTEGAYVKYLGFLFIQIPLTLYSGIGQENVTKNLALFGEKLPEFVKRGEELIKSGIPIESSIKLKGVIEQLSNSIAKKVNSINELAVELSRAYRQIKNGKESEEGFASIGGSLNNGSLSSGIVGGFSFKDFLKNLKIVEKSKDPLKISHKDCLKAYSSSDNEFDLLISNMKKINTFFSALTKEIDYNSLSKKSLRISYTFDNGKEEESKEKDNLSDEEPETIIFDEEENEERSARNQTIPSLSEYERVTQPSYSATIMDMGVRERRSYVIDASERYPIPRPITGSLYTDEFDRARRIESENDSMSESQMPDA